MAKEIDNKIESFLDSSLGRWTRLLFWREELLSSHLRQLYDKQLQENENHETAWENTLKDFGDVNHISEKLWQLHKPKRVFVRLLALLVALAVFCLIFGGKVGAFAQLESVAFLVLPVMLILPSLFFSSRLKLKDINLLVELD